MFAFLQVLSSYSVEKLEEVKQAIDVLLRLKADLAAGSSHDPGLSHDASHMKDAPVSVSSASDVLRMDKDESLVSSFFCFGAIFLSFSD